MPRRFAFNLTSLGALLVLMLLFVALAAPWLAPYDPAAQDLAGGLAKPSAEHWFGQDRLGRDQLSRVIYGAQVSLIVGLAATGASLLAGLAFGLIAGFYGGKVDDYMMRLVDVLLAFPGILLAIALAAVLGPSLRNVIIALSALGWVGYARLVRGEVLGLREREFVLAAKALGSSDSRVMLRHIAPNLIAPLMVQTTFGMAGVILGEASLSFLGLGAQGRPSWGGMITEGVEYLSQAPHLAAFPGLAIMAVVLGFNFLGDGLRDYLDPKRQR